MWLYKTHPIFVGALLFVCVQMNGLGIPQRCESCEKCGVLWIFLHLSRRELKWNSFNTFHSTRVKSHVGWVYQTVFHGETAVWCVVGPWRLKCVLWVLARHRSIMLWSWVVICNPVLNLLSSFEGKTKPVLSHIDDFLKIVNTNLRSLCSEK